jgi:hypothetical protein
VRVKVDASVVNDSTRAALTFSVVLNASIAQTPTMQADRAQGGNYSHFRFMCRKLNGIPPHGSQARGGDFVRGPQPHYSQSLGPATITMSTLDPLIKAGDGVLLTSTITQSPSITTTTTVAHDVTLSALLVFRFTARDGHSRARSRVKLRQKPQNNVGFTMSGSTSFSQSTKVLSAGILQVPSIAVQITTVTLTETIRQTGLIPTPQKNPVATQGASLSATITQSADMTTTFVPAGTTNTVVGGYSDPNIRYSDPLVPYSGEVVTQPPNAPTITGFSPPSGVVGSSVTITGTLFTDATDVAINGVSTTFTVVTDSVIVATVPSTTSGFITVTNPGGVGTSSAQFLIVSTPPTTVPPPTNNTTIQLGLPPRPDSGNFIVLDDPVRGKLDSTTFVLAPEIVYADITSFSKSTRIRRGKNRELDERTEAGSCTVVVHNETRRFDPANTAGPYWDAARNEPLFAPRRAWIRVSEDGLWQFTGQIEEIQPSYDNAGKTASVTITAADALAQLAEAKVTIKSPTAELAGARVARVLDRAGYKGGRDIAPGRALMSAEDIDASALDEISKIAQAEQTFLFVDPNGDLTYLDRTTLLNQAPSVILADNSVGGRIPYSDLDQQFGSELLWNEVTVTRRGDSKVVKPQSVGDLDSQSRYGKRSLEITDTPQNIDQDALYLAQFLLSRYKTPQLRFSSVEVAMRRWTLAQRQSLLALDIGSVVRVQRTPMGQGSPPVIDQTCTIIGIEHEAVPGNWTTRYTLESVETGSINASGTFTLDSPTFGKLDVNVLGF